MASEARNCGNDGVLITSLLRINQGIFRWKIFLHRLRFDRLWPWVYGLTFSFPTCRFSSFCLAAGYRRASKAAWGRNGTSAIRPLRDDGRYLNETKSVRRGQRCSCLTPHKPMIVLRRNVQRRGNLGGRMGSCPPNYNIGWAANVFCPPKKFSQHISSLLLWIMCVLTFRRPSPVFPDWQTN